MMMRGERLMVVTGQVDAKARETHGSRFVRAELIQEHCAGVSERLDRRLVHDAGIHEFPRLVTDLRNTGTSRNQ